MIGDPLSSLQPSPFFQIGTMGWVGVLTRCMRAWHHVTTSQNIRQPLWSDPQLLRAGCPPVFNGGCIEAAMPIESVTDVLTVVSAPVQRLRSEAVLAAARHGSLRRRLPVRRMSLPTVQQRKLQGTPAAAKQEHQAATAHLVLQELPH